MSSNNINNNYTGFLTEIEEKTNSKNNLITINDELTEKISKEKEKELQYKKILKIRKELLKPILPLPFDGLAIKQKKLKYKELINDLVPTKIEGRNENFLLFEKNNYPLIDLISCRKTTNNSNLLLKHLLISNQYNLGQTEQNTIINKSYKLPIKNYLNKKKLFKNFDYNFHNNLNSNVDENIAKNIKNCLSISQNKRYKDQSSETPNETENFLESVSCRGNYKKNHLREHYISLENNEFFRKEKNLHKIENEKNSYNDLNKYRKDLSNIKYNNHLRVVSPTVQKIHLPPLNLQMNNNY